jgi:hypothetical protein
MRILGALLITAGIFGFVHASDQLGKAAPLPPEMGWREGLEQPAGRWDLARYGCALGGGIGALMLLFPKGR